jgi:hypothetical protein
MTRRPAQIPRTKIAFATDTNVPIPRLTFVLLPGAPKETRSQLSGASITNSPASPFMWPDTNPPTVPPLFYRITLGPRPP